MIAGNNFDPATNLHPHLTDLAHKICIQRKWILAGSVTSLAPSWTLNSTYLLNSHITIYGNKFLE